MWLSNEQCGERVKASWRANEEGILGGTIGNSIITKVEKYGKGLKWWNRNCFGSVRRELEKKKKLLTQAKIQAQRSGCNQVKELKAKINILIDREARMWSQRSRVLWATKGDSNTKFFHS